MQNLESSICVLVCAWLLAPQLQAEELARSPILNVFPASTANPTTASAEKASTETDSAGETNFSTEFTPSKSSWDPRLQEEPVFQVEMTHTQAAENSYQLRIGKGGQIYSLRGAFGESVPPSWRPPNAHVSPWNDEVWQFVAVCTRYNGIDRIVKAGKVPPETIAKIKRSTFENGYFIHNSGAYIPGDSELKSFYCPLLKSETDQTQRCYRMLNWGLVPQTKTIHRSPLLYYTQIRDAGDGVIELTWVVHNFSNRDDIVFDHLNAPWGGTRISSLPLRYVSSPEGGLLQREGLLNKHNAVDVRGTGGWNISCATNVDDSPSLALVYGRDRHLEEQQQLKEGGRPYIQTAGSLYRDWRDNAPAYENTWKDWQTRPENSFRNYDVCEIIPKLRIDPGRTIWFRSFLVVGRKDVVMKQATDLVGSVDYGALTFEPASTPTKLVAIDSAASAFEVFTQPVTDTRPLFDIRNTENKRRIITTDPYYFVKKEPLNWELPEDHPKHDYYASAKSYSLEESHSDWKSMIGYGYQDKPASGNWKRLSELLEDSMFPTADEYHLDLWVKLADSQPK